MRILLSTCVPMFYFFKYLKFNNLHELCGLLFERCLKNQKEDIMKKQEVSDDKLQQLDLSKTDNSGEALTTNQGLKISNNQDSLKSGERGPSLLEDFILREKITHFDHERIPERIVHARGSGAHGVFKINKSLAKYTKANFLAEEGKKLRFLYGFLRLQEVREVQIWPEMSEVLRLNFIQNKVIMIL